MAKRIYPNWLPKLVNPVVIDAATDLRQLRGDYNGGAFAGPVGTFDTVVRSSQSTAGVGVGYTIVNSAAVPAGYRQVIQNVSVFHSDPTARTVEFGIISGGNYYQLISVGALVVSLSAPHPNEIVLEAGENLRAYGTNIIVTASLLMFLAGYQVRL